MTKIDQQGNVEVWTIMQTNPVSNFIADTVAAYYYQGYVNLVLMVADKVD